MIDFGDHDEAAEEAAGFWEWYATAPTAERPALLYAAVATTRAEPWEVW